MIMKTVMANGGEDEVEVEDGEMVKVFLLNCNLGVGVRFWL